jgi:hypothetical protein
MKLFMVLDDGWRRVTQGRAARPLRYTSADTCKHELYVKTGSVLDSVVGKSNGPAGSESPGYHPTGTLHTSAIHRRARPNLCVKAIETAAQHLLVAPLKLELRPALQAGVSSLQTEHCRNAGSHAHYTTFGAGRSSSSR